MSFRIKVYTPGSISPFKFALLVPLFCEVSYVLYKPIVPLLSDGTIVIFVHVPQSRIITHCGDVINFFMIILHVL